MKITRQTIDILKNFSSINPSIVVKEGSALETISTMKNILAKSKIVEDFDRQFAIYDLTEFLGLVTSEALVNAELEFEENWVNMVNGKSSSRYYYADESTIIKPEKKLEMPEPEIHFELSKLDLSTALSMSGILSKPDLGIVSDGKTISALILDKKDPTSDFFEIGVGEGNGDEYVMYFKIENLKILKGSYSVGISSRGIGHFSNQDIELEYWIALEPDSEYNI